MNLRFVPIIATASFLAGCAGGFVHVPPGTSVELALARKPEVLSMPGPPPSAVADMAGRSSGPRVRELNLPAVEPVLPTNDSVTAVAEAYTRGKDALDGGRTDDAISAFQQAVQIDPKFTEAWQKLAMAFEKAGRPDKAKEAYRHSKEFAQQ
jgi:tetratricopeptide (TPR) repeat protein